MHAHKTFLHTYRRPLGLALLAGGIWWLGTAIDRHLGSFAVVVFAAYLLLATALAYKAGQNRKQPGKRKPKPVAKTSAKATPASSAKTKDDADRVALGDRIAELENELDSERRVVAAMTDALSPDAAH